MICSKDYNYNLELAKLQEKYPYKNFKLLGMGTQYKAREVLLFELGCPTLVFDESLRCEIVKPDKIWRLEDYDARPFGLVKIDYGENGVSEKFMLGDNSSPHWKLYKKGVLELNKEIGYLERDHFEKIMNDVNKFFISLDGRLWTDSKIIVFRSSYIDYENRLKKIYESLLPLGIDILDYQMLIPKLIPEIEKVDLNLRGIYSCEVRHIINNELIDI